MPPAPPEPPRPTLSPGGNMVATGETAKPTRPQPLTSEERAGAVNFGTGRLTQNRTVGERHYPDIGGDEFVGGVLNLVQGLPKPDPHDSQRLNGYLQRQEEGEDMAAEISALRAAIQRKEHNATIHREVASALASGDRQRLKLALGQVRGGDEYRDRL